MRKTIFLLSMLFFLCLQAQRSFELPNSADGESKLYVYLPSAEKSTGRAIVCCPGGGYAHLAMTYEGTDWAPYFKYAISCAAAGTPIDTDWTGTIETGSVVLTDVNTQAAAEGTVEKMEEVKAGLADGSIHVFDTSAFTVKGETLTSYLADVDTDPEYTADTEVISDGYFHESEYRSAPYFDMQIDGIELLDTAF